MLTAQQEAQLLNQVNLGKELKQAENVHQKVLKEVRGAFERFIWLIRLIVSRKPRLTSCLQAKC